VSEPKDDGGLAFPVEEIFYQGMTLRDYFATAAMTGMFANAALDVVEFADVAHDAYLIADAMLEARNK